MAPFVESFVFGAANSLHCMCMCGPLTLGSGGSLVATSAYQGGRALSYTAVGAALGTSGTWLGTNRIETPSSAIAYGLAAAIVILALVGDRGAFRIPFLQRAMQRTLGVAKSWSIEVRALVLGIATPLLPCGLLWSMLAAAAIFGLLLLLHLLILNIAGIASGIFIGDAFFAAAGSNPIEILLLAFTAYNVVLPTLIGRACITAYDQLRPAFALDDRHFGQLRATMVDSFFVWRLGFGLFWAVILTPVFGDLFRSAIPGDGAAAALLTIWMYVRIALTFGLLGSSISYVALVHHRFRGATGRFLRVDLFDMAPLEPVARYARRVALFLTILLALAGPAIAQPEAFTASATLLFAGIVLTGVAVTGAMWGARRAIRAAKKTALSELHAYSRELWRRGYAGAHLTEAVGVAVPALGAMLTVRNEISRISDWPGGWAVFARLATLVIVPVLSWFGGQVAAQIMSTLSN